MNQTVARYLPIAAPMLVFAALLTFFATRQQTTAPPATTPAQQADLSLAQQSDTPVPALPGALPPRSLPGCALALALTPASRVVASGGTLQYRMTLVNEGRTTCEQTSISVYYASGETFLSATPTATADGYYWSLGALAPGKTFSAAIETKENGTSDNGQIDNEACASANNGKDACVDNLVFIGSAPPGSLASAAPPAAPLAGAVWGAAFASKEFGTWVWDYPDQIYPAYAGDLLEAAANNGFNAVYLTVDDYLPIASLPSGAAKTTQERTYLNSIATFVGIAKSKGIAVDLEGGAND